MAEMYSKNIDLTALMGRGFNPTRATETFGDRIRSRLGLKSKASAARIAIGRSLAEPSQPQAIEDDARLGQAIKGGTLFGKDTALWVSLVVEHAAAGGELHGLSQKEVARRILEHWQRGAKLLVEDYDNVRGDRRAFIKGLAEIAALPEKRTDGGSEFAALGSHQGELRLLLGEIGQIDRSEARAEWVMNRVGGSPHMGIFGTTGTGKTRTAKALFRQVKAAGIPLVIIDPKGDLNDDLVTDLGAKRIVLGKDPVPLDILCAASSSCLRVLDGLEESVKGAVPSLGAKQVEALRNAAKPLIEAEKADLKGLSDAVDRAYKRDRKNEDSLTAVLHKVRDYDLFRPEMGGKEFLTNSWVVSANEVSDEVLKFGLLFFLDYVVRYLKSLGDTPITDDTQGMRLCLAIDEARRVVDVASPSLMSSLVLECRSKGLACMFMSQSPAHLDKATDDIMEQIQAMVCFKARVEPKHVKRMFGRNGKAQDVENLERGHYLGKWPGQDDPVVVKAWEP